MKDINLFLANCKEDKTDKGNNWKPHNQLKTKDKEKTVKAARVEENIHIKDRGTTIRMMADFTFATMETTRQWNVIFNS